MFHKSLVQIIIFSAKYTVIAPGRIYSNEIYTAAISIHHTTQPCKVNVSISSPSYNEIRQVEVSPYQVKTVSFNVPTLDHNEYKFTAESVDCMFYFKNTTMLIIDVQTYDAIIQTDRGLYKPGNEINFRVLFMDKHLKPAPSLKNALIWFSDSQGNVVKEIHDIKTVMGVYTGRYRIPENSTVGEWSLGVLHRDDFETVVQFVVEDKYLVKVEASEAVYIYDGDLHVLVTAHYVCGKPVTGSVTISITLDVDHRFHILPPPVLNKTVKMVNGTAQVFFNVKYDYITYTYKESAQMKIVATVKEASTNITVSESINRYIYYYRYSLSCSRADDELNMESCFSFEGGRENNMIFQMKHTNGSFIKDTRSTVEFRFKEVLWRDFNHPLTLNINPISENKSLSFSPILNATGFARIDGFLLALPKYEGYHHYYEFSYKFMGEERTVFRSYDRSKSTKYFTLADQSGASKYTVIAPGRIYSNDVYTAAIAVHHTSQPCKINVSISGPSYNEMQQVVVLQYQVKTVTFNVPTLHYGDYSLTARGVDCMDDFENTTDIIYEEKMYETIIQTDRGLYRPGDEIHFRVLFMDYDLKPIEPLANSMIWFSDADDNVVRKIRDFKTVMGVYTDKFKIPETKPAGVWYLGVLNGEYYDTVAEFVVEDKYLVEVEATEAVSIKDGDLQLLVTANHVCGEPVHGKVDIEISLDKRSNLKPPPVLTKTGNMVNGKAELLFNVQAAYSNYSHDYRIQMIIEATVTEALTGVMVSQTIRRYIYPFRYTLSCSRVADNLKEESCSSFEGGRENNMLIQMMYINGSIVEDTNSNVEFTFTKVFRKDYRYTEPVSNKTPPTPSKNHTVVFNGQLKASGFVSINVLLHELPQYEGYLHYYSMKYKYRDEKRLVLLTYPTTKPTKYFFLAAQSSSDEKLYFNRAYSFNIKSSGPLIYFIYHVIGQRNIVKSDSVRISDKAKEYNLIITPKRSWGPEFRLYIYYVDENGEYHYDEKKYKVHVRQNLIMITASDYLVVGENATITLHTNPKTFVGLMAVDQRMLRRKHNNDLTASNLDKIYTYFGTYTPSQGGYSRYPGSSSGCVTLTNSDYFYSWNSIPRKPYIGLYGEGVVPRKHAQSVAMPSTDGQNMCETLAFENLESSRSGEIVFSKKVPDIKTTWVFTAFSVNPVQGFRASEKATEITVIS